MITNNQAADRIAQIRGNSAKMLAHAEARIEKTKMRVFAASTPHFTIRAHKLAHREAIEMRDIVKRDTEIFDHIIAVLGDANLGLGENALAAICDKYSVPRRVAMETAARSFAAQHCDWKEPVPR